MSTELDFVAGLIAILLGIVVTVLAYKVSRRYYAGPWKSAIVWTLWGASLFLVEVISQFTKEVLKLTLIPTWADFSIILLAFLCFLNATFAIRRMSEIYSSEGYKKFPVKNKSKS